MYMMYFRVRYEHFIPLYLFRPDEFLPCINKDFLKLSVFTVNEGFDDVQRGG